MSLYCSISLSNDQLFKVKSVGNCKLNTDVINYEQGLYLVRFRLYEICESIEIIVQYNDQNLGNSPLIFRKTYPEKCSCLRKKSLGESLFAYKCPIANLRIDKDLKRFQQINFKEVRDKVLQKFSKNSNIASICNYVIKDNKIYRKCEGKYTGFKVFMDSILLSITR